MSIKINGQVVIDDSRTACVCNVAIGGSTVIDSSRNVCATTVKFGDSSCLTTGNGLGVPTGTMAAYIYGTQPQGWLPLDNSTYCQCTYQCLYNCIGQQMGTLSSIPCAYCSYTYYSKTGWKTCYAWCNIGLVYCGCSCCMSAPSYTSAGKINSTGVAIAWGTQCSVNGLIGVVFNMGSSIGGIAGASGVCFNAHTITFPSSNNYMFAGVCNCVYYSCGSQFQSIPTQPGITMDWSAYGGSNSRNIYGSMSSPCIAYSQTADGICCYNSICIGDCLRSVASINNNTLFVGTPTCANGYLRTSTDGCSWCCYTNIPADMCTQCAFLACANETLLLSYPGRPAWKSTDGCNWTCVGTMASNITNQPGCISCSFTVSCSTNATAIAGMYYCCGIYYATKVSSCNNSVLLAGYSTNLRTWYNSTTSGGGYFPHSISSCLSYTTWGAHCWCGGTAVCYVCSPWNYDYTTQFKVPQSNRTQISGYPVNCCYCDATGAVSQTGWTWYIKT